MPLLLLSDMVPVDDQSGQATGTPLKVLTYLIEYNNLNLQVSWIECQR
jgi:hypothetical protein